MSSPVHDHSRRPSLPAYNINRRHDNERSSDEDQTVVGDHTADFESPSPIHQRHPPITRQRTNSYLSAETENDFTQGDQLSSTKSASQAREEAHRIDDDIQLLNLERKISRIKEEKEDEMELTQSNLSRTRSRRDDMIDEFDASTNPVHETTRAYKPPTHPATSFGKFIKRLHSSSWLVRNLTYATPVMLILLVPLLLGALKFKSASVGNVRLVWFMIWLEIVWLTLFAGRLLAKCLPLPIGMVASAFSNNSRKWHDMAKQLELPATLFFWWLGIEVSFLPTMKHHQLGDTTATQDWMSTMNKVLVSFFVGTILNFVEKIIIQLIAMSFHRRTYQDRIEINKFQIGSLTKLYQFSRDHISMDDQDFELPSGTASGARTPGAVFTEAQKQTKEAMMKFHDVAGKIAGDFAGKKVKKSTHPYQVVLTLLNSTGGSQVLARRLYRTFAREETQTVLEEDLVDAFENAEESAAAFAMFDKDLNGDISMEELEAVCVEIGRERKSITASLKDLDSVVSKLDGVLFFVVCVVVVLVFVSLISTSAAGVLTSAGSSVLALSWLFSATAQEFLQSCIFVIVKHAFDVGDRVTIYGNTGSLLKGDDYFVKSISLLYTEFKKMEGHVVQAPNSYLNTLFVLNHRRSGGLAEAVSVALKFGTTLEQIDGLRARLLDFVKSEKREYQSQILTELRDLVEMHQINLNVIFFYKSSWQNEGLRLARRNKFICALMVTIQELGIEGPRMRYPGQKESFPVYLQNVPHIGTPGVGHGGVPDNPRGFQQTEQQKEDPSFVAPPAAPSHSAIMSETFDRHTSIRGHRSVRRPQESLSHMDRRVDFSLGMQEIASGNHSGDVHNSPAVPRMPIHLTEASRSRVRGADQERRTSHEVARSSSFALRGANTGVARRSTESDRSRLPNHRNRFFGRHRADSTADAQSLMEGGMVEIPEHESSASNERIDPRSGLVSSAAWRQNSKEGNIRPTQESPTKELLPRLQTSHTSESLQSDPPGYTQPSTSNTENFEMRKFK